MCNLFRQLKAAFQNSFQHLSLDVPFSITGSDFEPDIPDVDCPVLETLELPGAKIQNTEDLCKALQHFRLLRSLDLSATAVNSELGHPPRVLVDTQTTTCSASLTLAGSCPGST
jgi:hypothetical protein